MGTKIIPAILLIIILVIGVIAFMFHNEREILAKANKEIKNEKEVLAERNSTLERRNNGLEKEKGDLNQRLSAIQGELSRVAGERDNLVRKWEEVSKQRDSLVNQLQAKRVERTIPQSSKADFSQEEHWADFIRKKAALEAQSHGLKKELLEANSEIAKLTKDFQELGIETDRLYKEKQIFEEEIQFKERTARIMSLDLVSEREKRSAAVTELKKLRDENIGLKKEIILANKEKVKLQERFKETMEKKDVLESRVMEIENIFKEKTLAFKELQEQIEEAVGLDEPASLESLPIEGKARSSGIGISKSAAVELPPIVVKPAASGLEGVQGEVIAVNHEEKFIVMDIGESSGLRPGALLKVVRANREIAIVEVIETRKEISAANIKGAVGSFDIKEGDRVVGQ